VKSNSVDPDTDSHYDTKRIDVVGWDLRHVNGDGSMRVVGVCVVVVEVPQIAPIAPYRSHLRSSSTTQSGIVRVDTDEGVTGWGEFNVNFLPN
jgi:hypothetical protein